MKLGPITRAICHPNTIIKKKACLWFNLNICLLFFSFLLCKQVQRFWGCENLMSTQLRKYKFQRALEYKCINVMFSDLLFFLQKSNAVPNHTCCSITYEYNSKLSIMYCFQFAFAIVPQLNVVSPQFLRGNIFAELLMRLTELKTIKYLEYIEQHGCK